MQTVTRRERASMKEGAVSMSKFMTAQSRSSKEWSSKRSPGPVESDKITSTKLATRERRRAEEGYRLRSR
jgi:hypothetical protein